MISTLVASALIGSQQPLELYRSFEKGKTYSYAVRTYLQSETRGGNVNTFIPSGTDINYDFTYKVLDVKSSGIAHVLYQRPNITEISGETADRGPVETKVPLNWKMELDLSPVNAVTGMKDLSQDKRNLGVPVPTQTLYAMSPVARQDFIGNLVGELQRLALFIGSLDSALDFSPKLPLGEVEVGETWRHTMSYQPMEIKGSGGKFEVQRLDMDLTYKGKTQFEGKTAEYIQGIMKLDSDAAKYINQSMNASANETGLAKLPLQLETTVDFYLDPKGLHTLKATAKTTGGWSIYLTGVPKAVQEERIKGKANITLKSIK